jgi:hypothetical protein
MSWPTYGSCWAFTIGGSVTAPNKSTIKDNMSNFFIILSPPFSYGVSASKTEAFYGKLILWRERTIPKIPVKKSMSVKGNTGRAKVYAP